MLVGYARTSTLEQVAGFEAQVEALKAAGCERIFQEQVSSVAKREQLELALDYIHDTDTLVVTKLDRLARSVPHLVDIVRDIEAKGASLKILDMGLDTGTPTGRLMLNVIGAVGQFEREMMLERQREGIAKAKSENIVAGSRQREPKPMRCASSSPMASARQRLPDALGLAEPASMQFG